MKVSATWNGWDKKRWILRARATTKRSSWDNSPIPKIAMISWRAKNKGYDQLGRWSNDLTFVILKDLLDGSGGIVVNITDNVWIHNTGGGFEWIDSWVETQFSDGTGQDSGGIQLHLDYKVGCVLFCNLRERRWWLGKDLSSHQLGHRWLGRR